MIAYLSGKIKIKHEKNFVVNVNGVGYLVNSTKGLLESVLEDQEIELYIHTNVREDDISLYGFKTQDEWKFFKLLLTVSGIGPKSALEILNAPMQKVRQAIAKKEVALLV
ncbi:MAG: Holliday junction branch migration protein RuvA, partial [Candidatus Gracilibacteria bacterium]